MSDKDRPTSDKGIPFDYKNIPDLPPTPTPTAPSPPQVTPPSQTVVTTTTTTTNQGWTSSKPQSSRSDARTITLELGKQKEKQEKEKKKKGKEEDSQDNERAKNDEKKKKEKDKDELPSQDRGKKEASEMKKKKKGKEEDEHENEEDHQDKELSTKGKMKQTPREQGGKDRNEKDKKTPGKVAKETHQQDSQVADNTDMDSATKKPLAEKGEKKKKKELSGMNNNSNQNEMSSKEKEKMGNVNMTSNLISTSDRSSEKSSNIKPVDPNVIIQNVKDEWKKATDKLQTDYKREVDNWIVDCHVVLAVLNFDYTQFQPMPSSGLKSSMEMLCVAVNDLEHTKNQIMENVEETFEVITHANRCLPTGLRELYNELDSKTKSKGTSKDMAEAFEMKAELSAPIQYLLRILRDTLNTKKLEDKVGEKQKAYGSSLHVQAIYDYRTVKNASDIIKHLPKATFLVAKSNGVDREKCVKIYAKMKDVESKLATPKGPMEEVLQNALKSVMSKLLPFTSPDATSTERSKIISAVDADDAVVEDLNYYWKQSIKKLKDEYRRKVGYWILDCQVVLAVLHVGYTEVHTSGMKLSAEEMLRAAVKDLKKNCDEIMSDMKKLPEIPVDVDQRGKKVNIRKKESTNELAQEFLSVRKTMNDMLRQHVKELDERLRVENLIELCSQSLDSEADETDKKQKQKQKHKVKVWKVDGIYEYRTVPCASQIMTCLTSATSLLAFFNANKVDDIYDEMEKVKLTSTDNIMDKVLQVAFKSVMDKLLPFTSRKIGNISKKEKE